MEKQARTWLISSSISSVSQLVPSSNSLKIPTLGWLDVLERSTTVSERLMLRTSTMTSTRKNCSSSLLQCDLLPKQYYLCSEVTNLYSGTQFPKCHFGYVSDVYKAQCPGCKRPMTKSVKFVKGDGNFDENEWIGGGVVKGVATYMVMDDLSFTPLSMIAGIGVLNKFNINIRDVEERTVEIGMEEGLQLLKASLQSKTALSDAFMVEKKTVVSPVSRKRKY